MYTKNKNYHKNWWFSFTFFKQNIFLLFAHRLALSEKGFPNKFGS
jgi:hypothetical protein